MGLVELAANPEMLVDSLVAIVNAPSLVGELAVAEVQEINQLYNQFKEDIEQGGWSASSDAGESIGRIAAKVLAIVGGATGAVKVTKEVIKGVKDKIDGNNNGPDLEWDVAGGNNEHNNSGNNDNEDNNGNNTDPENNATARNNTNTTNTDAPVNTISDDMRADPYHPDWQRYDGNAPRSVGADVSDLSFNPRQGSNGINQATYNDRNYEINTGHAWDSGHQSGVSPSSTGVSQNRPQSEIIRDLDSLVDSNSSAIPTPSAGMKNFDRTITVDGVSFGYRSVRLPDGTYRVTTFWAN